MAILESPMTPEVSIIIPCYNEQATITLLLDALHAQTYPLDAMEVVIADGGSTDGTRAVIDSWGTDHPDLKITLVPNLKKIIPAALNTAINASSGEIIIRLDAHSHPQSDYVERSVKALSARRGQNVGGVWDIQPGRHHWIARGIAAAAGHPIGVGDALYRYADQAGEVDTVPFGAFYRSLLDQVGLFDETLLTNEDYEFNTRIRKQGGKVWLDPQIRSVYYARGNLKDLAKQYWRYGYWKRQMLRRYPDTLRWRQALPPLFVLGLILLMVLGLFFKPALWALAGVLVIYLLFLFAAGVQLALRHKQAAHILGVPLAIATMHFAWGSGFLWGVLRPQKQNNG